MTNQEYGYVIEKRFKKKLSRMTRLSPLERKTITTILSLAGLEVAMEEHETQGITSFIKE